MGYRTESSGDRNRYLNEIEKMQKTLGGKHFGGKPTSQICDLLYSRLSRPDTAVTPEDENLLETHLKLNKIIALGVFEDSTATIKVDRIYNKLDLQRTLKKLECDITSIDDRIISAKQEIFLRPNMTYEAYFYSKFPYGYASSVVRELDSDKREIRLNLMGFFSEKTVVSPYEYDFDIFSKLLGSRNIGLCKRAAEYFLSIDDAMNLIAKTEAPQTSRAIEPVVKPITANGQPGGQISLVNPVCDAGSPIEERKLATNQITEKTAPKFGFEIKKTDKGREMVVDASGTKYSLSIAEGGGCSLTISGAGKIVGTTIFEKSQDGRISLLTEGCSMELLSGDSSYRFAIKQIPKSDESVKTAGDAKRVGRKKVPIEKRAETFRKEYRKFFEENNKKRPYVGQFIEILNWSKPTFYEVFNYLADRNEASLIPTGKKKKEIELKEL